MDKVTGFVGRVRETEDALDAIRRGSNVLVTGRAGIGKSAFLRHLAAQQRDQQKCLPIIEVPAGTTKYVLLEMVRQLHEQIGLGVPVEQLPPRIVARAQRQGWLHWDDLVRTVRRLSVADTVDIIVNALHKRKLLVVLESLEVPPSQASLFAQIVDAAQVVAAMDDTNRRVRVDRLLWRFSDKVVLKPLPLAECTTLIECWLRHQPVRFSSPRSKAHFIRHVARASGGNPAAIRGMLEAAAAELEITPAKARSFHHEASAHYLDMTPVLVILMVVFLAMRYISRGLGDMEMLVLSGVASAIFIGLRFFMSRMSAVR